jgi:hypothetical protein
MAQQRPMAFRAAFEPIAENAFKVLDHFHDRVVDLASSIPTLAGTNSLNFPVSETTALAALDGGFVFREGPGPEDDPYRQQALEQWIEERESSGDDWDEDDFVYGGPYDETFLGDGVYVCGRRLVAVLASELGVMLPADLDLAASDLEQARSELMAGATVLPDAAEQANLLLKHSMVREWAQFEALIRPGGGR